ncbi:unnamed protein product [Caenorhabditis brenneri]
MMIQSLKKIALEKVEQYARENKLLVPVKTPSDLSNLIFERYTLSYTLSKYRHAIESSSPMDFSNLFITKAVNLHFQGEILQLLAKHELKEIELSFLHGFNRTYADKVKRNDFQFVCDCLFKSRNSLTTLVCREFSDEFNWLDALLPLHPNLCNLNFEENTLFRFSTVLNVYPQITSLDFSNTDIINLEGLSSRFPNIEVLHLSNVRYQSLEDVQDIFQLQKLKFLDIACSYDKEVDENPWLFGQQNSFPSLEFVDWSQKYVCPESLSQLFASAPKLKKIGLIRTSFPYFNISREGVEILCTKDLSSAVKAFRHYHYDNRHLFVGPILEDIQGMLNMAPPFETHKKILLELLDLLLDRIQMKEEDYDMLAKKLAIKSAELFCQTYSGELSNEQKQKILLALPYDDREMISCSVFGLSDFIKVEGLNPFFFYQKAIDYFLDWETPLNKNHQALYPMLDSLEAYGSRLSDGALAKVLGKGRCLDKLRILFGRQRTVDRRFEENVTWNYLNCQKIQAAQEKMLESKMEMPIHNDQLRDIGVYSEAPAVQLIALEVFEKQLYCVESEAFGRWARSVSEEEFGILIKCLMGDLEESYFRTGTHLERKIAMIAMRILGVLIQYQDEEHFDLVAQIQQQATIAEYRDFFIPSLENLPSDEGSTTQSDHPIPKAGNIEEWATAIYEDLKKRATKHSTLNIAEDDGIPRNIMGDVLIKNEADNGYNKPRTCYY